MIDSSPQSLFEQLRAEVDTYVEELFEDFDPLPRAQGQDQGKVIRDPIHGFIYLSPLEVEVLDSPLVQRLRYIHQNALAHLIYPSARHSRLEHCLGMVKIVEDVASSIRNAQGGDLFDRTTTAELRLAALLHDSGHGIFSHLSEGLIKSKWSQTFEALRSHPEVKGKQPGEILSYLLVTSRRFRNFLEDAIIRHSRALSVQRIAQYIVGQVSDPSVESYKADLITGPLDCDKLDYLARDAYFTGIRLEVDVQQIVRNLSVWNGGGDPGRGLVIKLAGSSFVEQMHFARLLMYPAMYYHQKVRALECQIRALFQLIWDDPTKIDDPLLKFGHITDFLRLSDVEFLSRVSNEPALKSHGKKLLRRSVYRRALHIAASTVREPLRLTDYFDLVKLGDDEPGAQAQVRSIRDDIVNAANAGRSDDGPKLALGDVWLDIPAGVAASPDLQQCYVAINESEAVPIRKLFPIDDWLKAYGEHKWTAHVFCSSTLGVPERVNRAAKAVLEPMFNLKFEPRASIECKL